MLRTQRTAMLLFLLLFIAAGIASAQPMRMTAEQRTDSLAVQLNLSKEQKPKVLEVFTSMDQARRKAFEDAQGDIDAARASLRSIREDGDKKLKGILTEEQYAKYQKMQEEMRARRGQRSSNGQ